MRRKEKEGDVEIAVVWRWWRWWRQRSRHGGRCRFALCRHFCRVQPTRPTTCQLVQGAPHDNHFHLPRPLLHSSTRFPPLLSTLFLFSPISILYTPLTHRVHIFFIRSIENKMPPPKTIYKYFYQKISIYSSTKLFINNFSLFRLFLSLI